MAQIVLGMWTSHGPSLSTTPEQWTLRVSADLKRQHPFRGEEYSFDELVTLRKDEGLEEASALSERELRSASCQRAIEEMAERFAAAKIDVAVIMGNDQRELFLEDITPAMTVYLGETIWDQPATPEQAARMPPGIHEAEWGHSPPERREYPCQPELGMHVCKTLVPQGFDLAVSKKLPEPVGHWSSGAPHSLGFIYRQIMRDKVVPNLPILINTFFPPNQPTARRCFELGQAVGAAIRSWDKDVRVGVFGSGGMSHFVIDEAFDGMFFEALRTRDAETLCAIEDKHLQSGTSELKTWIAAAGVLFDTDLQGDVVGYEPCYRSAAGTGTANGFVAVREMMNDPYVARLRLLDACAVSDTLDKLGLAGCVTGLRSASPGRRIAGRVHTVKLKAGNAPADRPPVHLGAAAIDASGPDDVIVVEQRTGIDAGCWGGILSRAAQQKGVAGVICDGLARDVDEAREIGFPIFCRGYTARTARNRVYEDATDVPVTVGDFTVEPGFYAICDSSAAVFIAPVDIERVLDAAEEIVRKEAEMTRRLESGEGASAVLGANYEYMLKSDYI